MNYYGYKPDEVLEMTAVRYSLMARLMYINEARDILKEFDVSAYPNLKEQKRVSIHKEYSKIAYPSNFEHKDIVKLSDLNRVLK